PRVISGEPDSETVDRPGEEADQVPGASGTDLLAGVWRARTIRIGEERAGEEGKDQGADWHRSRSTRLRFGSIAISRDRIDEGRQRRGCRLAVAQCHAEYGCRRVLGFHSQRWWGGNWVFAARRTSHRGGWNGCHGQAD